MTADIESCFRAHRDRVYRWAFGLCGRSDEALDIVQDVFVRMLENRPALAGEPSRVAWLRRVTGRIAIDRWRSRGRRAQTGLSLDAESGGSTATSTTQLESAEQAAQLRAALATLSEQQRLVVLCKVYDEMTFSEVATELGVSIPTAKTHYLRALAAVRDHLGINAGLERVS